MTKDTSKYPYVYTATVKKDTTGGNTEATYTAKTEKASNGTVALDKDKDLKAGDTVTVTATPDGNYEIGAVTVTTENNKPVNVTGFRRNLYILQCRQKMSQYPRHFKKKPPVGNGVI